MVKDETLLFTELGYFYAVLENGYWSFKLKTELPQKKCSELSNIKEKEEYYKISLSSWNCIDFDNITIGGSWDGNFVRGLVTLTRQCNFFKGNKACRPAKEIQETFSKAALEGNYFYSDLSLEVLPSMDDFENPLKTNLVNR